MTASSTALFALAALLKGGLSVRQALLAWPEELTGDHRVEALEVVRRLQLGSSVTEAVKPCSLAWVLLPALSVHFATGVDLVAWLERVAVDREEVATAHKAARGAAAGATLSARMVAGLPLLFVPLTPMARAPLTDGVGVVMLLTGVCLAITGLRWIGRLLPQAVGEDATAELCVSLSAMLRAGLSVHAALQVAASQPGAARDVVRSRRLVQLGASWPEALDACGGDLTAVAASIRRAQRFGTPLADGLDAIAACRRAEQERGFEEKLKRAPVLMVVPLACCILPAYVLLGLGPFLRSMSLG
jgi:tight adherence protein B